jgi:hypothetical protein
MLRILQVCPTLGKYCGIALFAERFAAEIRRSTLNVVTVREMTDTIPADIVLLQHHPELLDDGAVHDIVNRAKCPVIVFAHAPDISSITEHVSGVMAMHPKIIPQTSIPSLVFPHPAWVPEQLSCRDKLRDYFSLPRKQKVLGTCGFLRFERQIVEILSRLLPTAAQRDWILQVTISPWYIESPGLIDQIIETGNQYPGHFVLDYQHLNEKDLNLRLQVCDVLWCWTQAESSPYASGVVSDMYASGTHIVAADKMQHDHILQLPNVVRASSVLGDFLDELIEDVAGCADERHDPGPVSWHHYVDRVVRFFYEVWR